MMNMNIGDVIDLSIDRSESNFDRACDSAYRLAILRFKIDENGHSSFVSGWERSCCWVELKFVSYIRIGNGHLYKFKASTKKEISPVI